MDKSALSIPKERASIRHLVEERLRELIANGHFRPGDHLVERELCEMLGVGRTSVREALRQLEAEGLIRTEPHRGPFVSKVTRAEAEQLYQMRALLEGFCGAEFAARGTEAEHAAFRRAFDAFARVAEGDAKTADLVAAKTEFYRCLIDGARNVFVKNALTTLHNRVTMLRATTMTHPGRLPESLREIREVTEAVCTRDAEAARRASIRHVEASSQIALALIGEGQGSDSSSVQG